MLVAEQVGEFFALLQQVRENIEILRIGAIFVGQIHALAQVGVLGELEDGSYVRRIAGERDGAVGGGLVKGDEVFGQAVEFGAILDDDLELRFLDVALKLRGDSGDVVVEGFDFGASRFVFIDAGEAKFEQRAFHVVLGGGVAVRNVDGGESFVNLVIERESGADGADFLHQRLGAVADGGVGVDDLH